MMYQEELRDKLALKAPVEVPSWFEKVEPKFTVDRPKHYLHSDYDNHIHKDKMRDWHCHDRYIHYSMYEKYPDVKQYMDEWNRYFQDQYESKRKAEQETYFKWRYFYADKMIEERNKE